MVWMEKLGPDATEQERQIFRALDNPKWGWRTIGGIAEETGLEPSTVRHHLLQHHDLVRASISEKYGPIYQLIERTEPPVEKFIDGVWDYLSMGRRRIA